MEIVFLIKAVVSCCNKLLESSPIIVAVRGDIVDYQDTALCCREQILSYHGRRICMVTDHRWRNKSAATRYILIIFTYAKAITVI